MPRSAAKRFPRGLMEHSVDDKNREQSTDLTSFKRRNVHGLRLTVPHYHELKRSRDALACLWKDLSGTSKQAKMVGNLPQKSTLKPLSAD